MDREELERIVKQQREDLSKLEMECATTDLLMQELEEKMRELRTRAADQRRSRYSLNKQLHTNEQQLLAIAQAEERARQEALEASLKQEALLAKWMPILKPMPGFNKARHYQVEGILEVLNILDHYSGALNADDMGLGKTMQAAYILAAKAQEQGGKFKILWLTKVSLIESTAQELNRWTPTLGVVPMPPSLPKPVRDSTMQIADMMPTSVIITNYESVASLPRLKARQFDMVVVDEVHKLKGGANRPPTAIWQNCKEVCESAKHYLFLTGTPVQNKPSELWAYLHIFDPVRFASLTNFERIFCKGFGSTFGVDTEQLMKILSAQLIRRTKREVRAEMPEKQYIDHFVSMYDQKGINVPSQKTVYEQLRDQFYVWLDSQQEKMLTATAVIAQLIRLRQINIFPGVLDFASKEMDIGVGEDGPFEFVTSVHNQLRWAGSAKLDETIDLISELKDQGEQVVVFSAQFNPPLDWLKETLTSLGYSCEVINGATSKFSSQYEQRFQQGELDVLLINLKAGAEGLNLQKCDNWPGGASHAIFLDVWYNPGVNRQGEDRLDRINTNAPVFIHRMIDENSVDQYMLAILEEKETMIQGISENNALRPSQWKDSLKKYLGE